jgi:hypothetical protein
MNIGWLRFRSEVVITSARPLPVCTDALRSIIAAPATMNPLESAKPYRGFVEEAGGQVRQKFPKYGIIPARVLRFSLNEQSEGCSLVGAFELMKPIRILVAVYLSLCVVIEIWDLIAMCFGHRITSLDLGPLISIAMIFGWTCSVVWLNRNREAVLVKSLRHVMADERSAMVVADLLSSSR